MEITTKKVCIIGGESTYKTTISENLSKHFKCEWVEEYAREYFKNRDFQLYPFCEIDFINVANGQLELEINSIRNNTSNNLIICDTCPLITLMWSKTLIGNYSTQLLNIVKNSKYDLYLFLDYKTKWVKDGLRLIPEEEERKSFQLELTEKCLELSIQYHFLEGTYEEREKKAIDIIENWLLK